MWVGVCDRIGRYIFGWRAVEEVEVPDGLTVLRFLRVVGLEVLEGWGWCLESVDV